MAGGTPAEGTVTRLTEDNDSRLPRYYYSVWDHYLSPAWSPDGRELIIVSNHGHIHGSGGFWCISASSRPPPRGRQYEATTWKTPPGPCSPVYRGGLTSLRAPPCRARWALA